MADKKHIDEISGTETTGHEWDGIEELNTPMPRWWLWIFYATIIWAIVYAVIMPAIPALPGMQGYSKGVINYSDRAEVMKEVDAMRADRAIFGARLKDITIEDLQDEENEENAELFRFAMAAGRSAFGDNCATCHGSGAQGFKGYPNLNDDVWLWGGSFDEIRQTINYGIRSAHDETRISLMSAYGRDEVLTSEEINDLTQYILNFSGQAEDHTGLDRAAVLFEDNCASCHGSDAKGLHEFGAPNLTDQEWLYGSEPTDIFDTIYYGRQGMMPNWNERLSPEMISALAVYVHSLGGGEATPVPASEE
jgi:cytochrome c oxidase cbb3-type subunit 3